MLYSQRRIDFPVERVESDSLRVETESSGVLNTFSLSFVGNLNFAKALEGIRKIIDGISSCRYRKGLKSF